MNSYLKMAMGCNSAEKCNPQEELLAMGYVVVWREAPTAGSALRLH